MTNSADPDQLASSEANWSGSTLFAKAGYRVYLGSAGPGLKMTFECVWVGGGWGGGGGKGVIVYKLARCQNVLKIVVHVIIIDQCNQTVH